jgi:hypothetical protein
VQRLVDGGWLLLMLMLGGCVVCLQQTRASGQLMAAWMQMVMVVWLLCAVRRTRLG